MGGAKLCQLLEMQDNLYHLISSRGVRILYITGFIFVIIREAVGRMGENRDLVIF